MRTATKHITIALLGAACAFSAAAAFTVMSPYEVSAESNTLIYERLESAAVAGSNYQLAQVMLDYNGTKDAKDSDWWGIAVTNLSDTAATVRCAIEAGGTGGTIWQSGSATVYLASDEGTTTTYTPQNGAQNVVIPGEFKGTLYFKKTELHDWAKKDAAFLNGAQVLKGFRVGYDYRQSYYAKLAFNGVKAAQNVTAEEGVSGEKTVITAEEVAGGLAAGKVNILYLGTIAEDVKPKMTYDLRLAKNEQDLQTVRHCTVTFSVAEGFSAPAPLQRLSGEKLGELPKAPEGWDEVYTGWATEDGTPVNAETAVEGNMTLKPVYEKVLPYLFERHDATVPQDGNYVCGTLMVEYADAPMLNEDTSAYWGITVKNFGKEPVTVRYGFMMGGGQTCWLPTVDVDAYFVWENGGEENGTIQKLNYVGKNQRVEIPAYFEGTIYIPKANLLNIEDPSVAESKCRVKGICIGYDFRQSFTAKLALVDVRTADVTETAVTGMEKVLNLAKAAESAKVYLGTPSEEAKDVMGLGVSLKRAESAEELVVERLPEQVYRDEFDETDKYIILDRTDPSVSSIKTGFVYYTFAVAEWRQGGENALGTGNCIGIRLENIGVDDLFLRITLRRNNVHRTSMGKNDNAFAWFLPDGEEEAMSSVVYHKEYQYLMIPKGAAGTVYLDYEHDFSWKGHKATDGISHISFGLDLRSQRGNKLVLKEVFDASYTVKENAVYTDIEDELDNAAGVNTHFTTDVEIENLRSLLNFKAIDETNSVTYAPAAETLPADERHDMMILANTNFNPWENFLPSLVEPELAKISVREYDEADYQIKSLAVKTAPRTEYAVGDVYDWSEGVVTVTYESGRTEDLPLTSSRLTVTGFDTTKEGKVTVTVVLKAAPEVTATFEVTVSAAPAVGPNDPVTPGGDPKPGENNGGGCGSVSVLGCGAVSVLAACALLLFAGRKKRKD